MTDLGTPIAVIGQTAAVPEGRRLYVGLEGARGLAAFLVAVRHLQPAIEPIIFDASFVAVDLFFLLSGFVMALSYEDRLRSGRLSVRRFLGLRLIRVYPLYVLGTLIGLLALGISGPLAAALPFAALALPVPFDPVAPFAFNPPGWSLLFELIACAVYGLWLSRAKASVVAVVSALAGAGLLVGIVWHGNADIGFQRPLLLFGVFRVLFSFSIGILFCRYRRAWPLAGAPLGNRAVLTAYGVILVLLCAPTGLTGALPMTYDALVICVALPIVVALLIRSEPSGALRRESLVLGRFSYPLYATHATLYMLGERLTGGWFTSLRPVGGLLVLFSCIEGALLLDRYVDGPVRAVLKRRLMGEAG